MENHISKTFASKFEGCTPQGTEWLVKTCDPASSKEIYMLPDATNQDRVTVEIRTTQDIIYPGSGATWDCRVGLTPHPLYLGFARSFNSGGTSVLLTTNIMNPTLDTSVMKIQDAFSSICEKSRISYASLTANLVCTDLTNQGTVYSVQYQRPYSEVVALYGGPNSLMRKAHIYDVNDNLTTEQISSFKSSYVGQARDGVYSVLKIPAIGKWVASEDTILTGYTVGLLSSQTSLPELDIATTSSEPYPLPNTMYWTGSSLGLGEAIQKPFGKEFGLSVFKGLDKSASVRLTYRMGLEMIVRPNTTYAPLLQSPSLVDLRAIQIHDEVMSLLADAYPASYNDLGKFLGFLKKAAGFANKNIFPLVDAVLPGGDQLTSLVRALASPIGKMIDSKIVTLQQKKVKSPNAVQPKKK